MKIKIPKDFPVRPLKPGQEAKVKATCGTCGLSWDDAIPTTWTPAPSARCPFEYFHPAGKSNQRFALASWHADDIQALRPGWAIERCEAFLKDHERAIEEAMISAGWEAIETLLD